MSDKPEELVSSIVTRLVLQAEALVAQGKLNEALTELHTAKTIALNCAWIAEIGNLSVKIAFVYLKRDDIASGIQELHSALKTYEEIDDKYHIAYTLLHLASATPSTDNDARLDLLRRAASFISAQEIPEYMSARIQEELADALQEAGHMSAEVEELLLQALTTAERWNRLNDTSSLRIAMARFYSKKRKTDDASLQMRQNAVIIYEKLARLGDSADTALEIATIQRAAGNLREAEYNCHYALMRYRRLSRVEDAAACLMELGRLSLTRGELSSALGDFQEATLILERRPGSEAYVDALLLTGNVQRQLGNWVKAERTYAKARAAARQLGDFVRMADADTGQALISMESGRAGEAEQALLKLCDEYDALEFPEGKVFVFSALGDLYEHAQRHLEAESSLLNALKQVESGQFDLSWPVTVRMRLGDFYRDRSDWSSAENHYHVAHQMCLDGINDRAAVETGLRIGLIFQRSGDFTKAESTFERCLELARERRERAQSLLNLSDLWLETGDPRAEQAFEQGMNLLSKIGLHQDAAAAATKRAKALSQLQKNSSQTPVEHGEDSATAIRLACHAALYLGSARLQFESSTARSQFASQVLQATSLVLQLAVEAGSARLVSELIETQINAVVHAAPASVITSTAIAAVMARCESDAAGTELTAVAHAFMSESSIQPLIAAGSSFLIAQASLPASPPPLLRMPSREANGSWSVALSAYHSTSPYPSVLRAGDAISTW